MAFIEDPGRVAETTTGTGTGAITVLGAVAGYQRFSAKLSVGDTFPGAIVASDNTWQEGIFTYSGANQITFTTILDGSSGASQITLPAGTHTVFAGFLGMGKTIANAPAKNPPVGGDLLALWDSVANVFKSLSITNLLALFRGANTFTAAQEFATGTNIASAATVNLNTATGNRVHITGTTTITAVTLTRGPRTVVFDGILTLTHHATNNNLPGAANITTAAGDRAIYESDGTTVYCVAYVRADGTGLVSASVGNHAVVVHTGNGHGSTNTVIRRFTTTLTSVGTALTYADSAANGGSVTVNEAGLYAISYSELVTAGNMVGVSINSAELTTSITTILVATRAAIAVSATASTGFPVANLSTVVRCAVNDVIRAHTNSAPTDTTDKVFFSVRKIGT